MRISPVFAVCFASFAFTCGHEGRASPTLDLNSSSTFIDGKAAVSVKVANRGDEPAMAVWVEAILADRTAASRKQDTLEVGETSRFSADFGEPPRPAGVYTVALKIHYADANGYRFSVLSSIPLVTESPDDLKDLLQADLPTADIGKDGELTLTIVNSGKKPLEVRPRLVLPDEMVSPRPAPRITLHPGMEKRVRFGIRNLGALPGSAYPVFAVVDYDSDNIHRSICARGNLHIRLPWWRCIHKGWSLAIVISLAVMFVLRQFKRFSKLNALVERTRAVVSLRPAIIDIVFSSSVLLAILVFTLFQITPNYLFMNTLTVGGDTPAHNYLASHLRHSLFSSGRIVSWDQGWWCGFPMFQFYFPLPYLLIALLDTVLPFNIAFKLVSILGIIALPPAAYAFARILRLPKPVPVLMAVAMIPFLFVRVHTMWGVNVYSTFAGMIANSISFPIMLIFIASAYRDACDGQFRLRSVALLALLISSHFFTSLMAGLVLLLAPFLQPRENFFRSMAVLAREAALGFLLMAWWLIPLAAKTEYSVDFGQDWPLVFCKTLPLFVFWLYPFMFAALGYVFFQNARPMLLIGWMLLISVLLFKFGSRISTVFDNVRLWPFAYFSLLMLAAAGLGLLIHRRRATELAVLATLVVAFIWGIELPNDVPSWARWNYEGLQNKETWPVFEKLVLPLDGTPGRLANDLHHDNNSLGSSRIFECVPHLIRKPILEGGIVNSALGSMFSYYIQGETSRNCAGFPNIVKPAAFNFANATKHLELFNVKHFIARWEKTKEALAGSRDWRRLAKAGRWELYELTTHGGRYVVVPRNPPIGVRLAEEDAGLAWKEAGLQWIYTIEALDQPFVLLRPGEPFDEHVTPILGVESFRDYLSARKKEPPPDPASPTDPVTSGLVTGEEVSDSRIRFKTTALGMPHIIKCSYYPNWKVRGARKVYMVTPCFMLVYPEQEEVELYYGYTLSDNMGKVLSALGLTIALAAVIRRRYRNSDEPLPNRHTQGA